MPKTRHLPNWT
ncbi:hypothetical protein F383_07410 [Gossypium arboreum]|uniref:Uncharacterized protein n=1 Tax=Gossypium arboreum TaxID=29729 RepID=A0A0B0PEI6_GOSAR|nr:hypothetical protein F383_07410 [Gossypium arboreum]